MLNWTLLRIELHLTPYHARISAVSTFTQVSPLHQAIPIEKNKKYLLIYARKPGLVTRFFTCFIKRDCHFNNVPL